MATRVLSKSWESVANKDPFSVAKEKYDSKKSMILSKSSDSSAPVESAPPDMKDILSKIGISHDNIAINDIGRVQLSGRLREKYGENYINNPEALNALDMFDKNLNYDSEKSRSSMNQSLSNANRTLGALLKGKK